MIIAFNDTLRTLDYLFFSFNLYSFSEEQYCYKEFLNFGLKKICIKIILLSPFTRNYYYFYKNLRGSLIILPQYHLDTNTLLADRINVIKKLK